MKRLAGPPRAYRPKAGSTAPVTNPEAGEISREPREYANAPEPPPAMIERRLLSRKSQNRVCAAGPHDLPLGETPIARSISSLLHPT